MSKRLRSAMVLAGLCAALLIHQASTHAAVKAPMTNAVQTSVRATALIHIAPGSRIHSCLRKSGYVAPTAAITPTISRLHAPRDSMRLVRVPNQSIQDRASLSSASPRAPPELNYAQVQPAQ
jgi:hypothetical protein